MTVVESSTHTESDESEMKKKRKEGNVPAMQRLFEYMKRNHYSTVYYLKAIYQPELPKTRAARLMIDEYYEEYERTGGFQVIGLLVSLLCCCCSFLM